MREGRQDTRTLPPLLFFRHEKARLIMAKVHVPHLAGQTTHSSRFGEITFNKKGYAEVDDATARLIAGMGIRGWTVSDIAPDDEVDGAVEDEELDDDDLGLDEDEDGDEGGDEGDEGDDDGVPDDLGDEEPPPAEGEEPTKPAKKKSKKKGKKGKKSKA